VAFVGKAADEVKVTILSKSFGAKKIQELVKTEQCLLASLKVVSGRMWPDNASWTTLN
jgi:hypothetical protein